MTDFEGNDGVGRDELVQRLALMEAMVAEGRRSTVRWGWTFVLWGLVDISGMVWQLAAPGVVWSWAVCISAGFVLQFLGISVMRRRGQLRSSSVKGRSLSAVWSMMGVGLTLYCFTGALRGKADQVSFLVAIFMMVGLAHAISAVILRWGVQGAVAASWWIAGLACFFLPLSNDLIYLFIGEMLVGGVFFGLYAMWLERRTSAAAVQQHA
jgi:NADH:ubiquinone oxidoreductase subunit 2 (subunit N)